MKRIGSDKHGNATGYRLLPSKLFCCTTAKLSQGRRQFFVLGRAATITAVTDNLLFARRDLFQFQAVNAIKYQNGLVNHDIKLGLNALTGLNGQIPNGIDPDLVQLCGSA
jgi:hypothetical protein